LSNDDRSAGVPAGGFEDACSTWNRPGGVSDAMTAIDSLIDAVKFLVYFAPADNANAEHFATFQFQVSDSGELLIFGVKN
jgi:hypothetical protein